MYILCPPMSPAVLLCGHWFHLLEHPSGWYSARPITVPVPFAGVKVQLGCEHILCRAHLIQLTIGTEIMSVRYVRKGSLPRRLWPKFWAKLWEFAFFFFLQEKDEEKADSPKAHLFSSVSALDNVWSSILPQGEKELHLLSFHGFYSVVSSQTSSWHTSLLLSSATQL